MWHTGVLPVLRYCCSVLMHMISDKTGSFSTFTPAEAATTTPRTRIRQQTSFPGTHLSKFSASDPFPSLLLSPLQHDTLSFPITPTLSFSPPPDTPRTPTGHDPNQTHSPSPCSVRDAGSPWTMLTLRSPTVYWDLIQDLPCDVKRYVDYDREDPWRDV